MDTCKCIEKALLMFSVFRLNELDGSLQNLFQITHRDLNQCGVTQ